MDIARAVSDGSYLKLVVNRETHVGTAAVLTKPVHQVARRHQMVKYNVSLVIFKASLSR